MTSVSPRKLRELPTNSPALKNLATFIFVALVVVAAVVYGRYIGKSQRAAGKGEGTPDEPGFRVVGLKVDHYRGSRHQHLGEIGDETLAARVQDGLRVRARFAAPAYCYLLAFNPDGTQELCYPASSKAVPEKMDRLTFPHDNAEPLPVEHGPGLQAYMLIVSEEELPSFETWLGKTKKPEWLKAKPEGVWRYDGQFERLAGNGRESQRLKGWPPYEFTNLCEQVRDLGPSDAVVGMAFPVIASE